MVEPITEKIHAFLGINNLLFITIVCICLLVSSLLNKYKVIYISESGAHILVGFAVGIFASISGRSESKYISFKPEIFFYLLLPPIVFEAGFNLKRKNFFNNIGSILIFSIFGTFLTTLTIGMGLCGLSKLEIIPINDCTECFIFGSLLSAVDPISLLSLLSSGNAEIDQTLYSLIFGESVLNDSISIILFKSFEDYAVNYSGQTSFPVRRYFFYFLVSFVGSVSIGLGMGLICSFILKQKENKLTPSHELAIILLFSYGTYCLAEIISFSGVVSLFFCGLTMSYYAYFSLSTPVRYSATYIFRTFSLVAETFLFAYLGIYTSVFLFRFRLKWSFALFTFSAVLCLVSRALSVVSCSVVSNVFRKNKITSQYRIIMFFAGIRGAVSFALVLNASKVLEPYFIQKTKFSGKYLVSTTLSIVLLSTFVLGGILNFLLREYGFLKSGDKNSEDPKIQYKEVENELQTSGNYESIEPIQEDKVAAKTENSDVGTETDSGDSLPPWFVYWMAEVKKAIISFDEKFMKKMFGGQTAGYEFNHVSN